MAELARRVAFHADVVLARHVTHKNVCEAFERERGFWAREKREGSPSLLMPKFLFSDLSNVCQQARGLLLTALTTTCIFIALGTKSRSQISCSTFPLFSRTMFLKGEMLIRLQPGSSKSSIALDCLPLKFFFVYFPPSLLPFGGIVIMIQRNLVHLLNVAILP